METKTSNDGDISCGTCFLIEDEILVTCKHNVEGRSFSLYIDAQTKISDEFFDIRYHDERDIAVLTFKSEKMKAMVEDLIPFSIDVKQLSMGDQLITMGYPLVAQRYSQLLVDVGTFRNYTNSYIGNLTYLTFSNRIDGGCSGGPVISLNGKVVGIITESTEQSNESNSPQSGSRGVTYSHGTPIAYLKDIL